MAVAALGVVASMGLPGGPAVAEESPPSLVSFVADQSEITVPGSTQVRAVADRSLYNTGYRIHIIDDDGETGEAVCGNGYSCGKEVLATWGDSVNPRPRRFHAEIRHMTTGEVVSTSEQVTVQIRPHDFQLRISADSHSITAPSSTTVRATVGQSLYNSGYRIHIVDDDGETGEAVCGNGYSCAKTVLATWNDNANPRTRDFHAEVRYMPNGQVVATSAQVAVAIEPYDFGLTIEPESPSITVPHSTRVLATVNRSLYNSGYRIHIVDDDGETSEAVCGNGDSCAKTVLAPWSVNANPTARQFHAEVRSFTTGHVAAVSDPVTVVRRRYIFRPTLSFWTKLHQNGHLIQKASARMGPTDPSLNGTGHEIKIRNADGSQLCSAPQVGCDATVTIGGTYRAVVETPSGLNVGDSGAWTLTDSGPQPATVGDLDLAALAVASAGVDICTRLGLSPYKTNLVGPPTSAGDQWEACAAAAAAGASTLAILMAVAETPGGEANLWWLQGDVTKEAPAPEAPPTPDDTKAPRPLPPPLLPDIHKLADRLMGQNQKLDQQVADDVATQCAFLHWRAGEGSGRCSSLPIFASGSDVAQATDHDLRALAEVGWAPWLVLNRERSRTKPGRGWQSTGGRCSPTELEACHEYPFFGTEQGGPRAYVRGPDPIIGLVLDEHNGLQGTRYSQFISACHMKTGTPDPTGQENSTGGDRFLSIPLPPEWERPTLWLCNGKTE
jgi:hypothetical protein